MQEVHQVRSLELFVFPVEEHESELFGQQLSERLVAFVCERADDALIVEPVVERKLGQFRVRPLGVE